MKIIAGELRGRRMLAPEGLGTRPMLGRAREALFSSIGDEVCDARILDLFSGTGSLGLEAISRGAQFVHYVERNPKVIRVLERNLSDMRVSDRAQVRTGDALAPTSWGQGPYDMVFMDPPYPMLKEPDGRRRVLAAVRTLLDQHLTPFGLLMLHTEPRAISEHDFDESCEVDQRKYGRTILWYVRKREETQ
ncbi:MAG: 16S rRNA (guanine(966)-N(2))-methyltransferase RsmD [Planctomycetes bacterium]|nr:16S rRNA (guanine(966)-N(2))-methyltransferase RsmD [Planctomycetota bacterium]